MFRFYSPSRPFLLLRVNRAKIEAELCGLKPEARLSGRRVQSKPLIIDMETWLVHQRARVSAKAPLGEALKYIAKYWNGLCLSYPMVILNSIQQCGKNALFAGHEAGAHNRATIASLIETCKLNAIDPQNWLTSTLAAIDHGHKQNQIDELFPWNYTQKV